MPVETLPRADRINQAGGCIGGQLISISVSFRAEAFSLPGYGSRDVEAFRASQKVSSAQLQLAIFGYKTTPWQWTTVIYCPKELPSRYGTSYSKLR